MDFDYIGTLVAILSFSVTLLIGWQIWNIIDFDDKVNRKIDSSNEKLKNEVRKDIDRKIKDYDHHLGAVMSHTKANHLSIGNPENKRLSIFYYFQALHNANQSTYKDNIPNILDDLKMTIIMPDFKTSGFTSENIKYFQDILQKSKEKIFNQTDNIDIMTRAQEIEANIQDIMEILNTLTS